MPIYRHRGTNYIYLKSVAEMAVVAGAKAMVSGCVAAMAVLEEMEKT